MTAGVRHNTLSEISNLLFSNGFDGIKEVLETLLNSVSKIERDKYLGCNSYERHEERVDYSNGYKPKLFKTRVGELNLQIPQVRKSGFYPSFLSRGLRSERALITTLAEMYVQGVSTRKVTKVLEELCGLEISSSDVSRAASELDVSIDAFRKRAIGKICYLILDARYETIRQENGHVRDNSVLIAYGVNDQGKREILGVSVSLSEAEVHWREFLESLVKRGMHGVSLVVSDAHIGLKAARTAVFPSVAWQRCQFHLQQNASSYVPKKSMKKEVAQDIRDIFNSSSLKDANEKLKKIVEKYSKTATKLSEWMEENLPQAFTVFNIPESHRKKLRTSNLAERTNQEIKRRTRQVRVFPNQKSCTRLIAAILVEKSEEWAEAPKYLSFLKEPENEVQDSS